MKIDLRKGLGDHEEYKLEQFPDKSFKFYIKNESAYFEEVNPFSPPKVEIITTLRSNDDLIILGLVKSTIDTIFVGLPLITTVAITYMMYQQDDRLFGAQESFGLRFISKYINFLQFTSVEIFHPHSDKVEMIDNTEIIDNSDFIEYCLEDYKIATGTNEVPIWAIPDSGAFKTQFKQIQSLGVDKFIECKKSRDHKTGAITTIVNTNNLKGKDCIIFDDICLGGRTFIGIAQELKKKKCGKLYLAVSHGLFNAGIDHLLEHFDMIYTTNSICQLDPSERLNIFKLNFEE